jgi:hypothetical protein
MLCNFLPLEFWISRIVWIGKRGFIDPHNQTDFLGEKIMRPKRLSYVYSMLQRNCSVIQGAELGTS